MKEEILQTCGIRGKKGKQSIGKTFPTISRIDIMSGILSPELTKEDRFKLSNLYAEITYMEKKELKYIKEITVSSQDDLDIYEMLKSIRKQIKAKEEVV